MLPGDELSVFFSVKILSHKWEVKSITFEPFTVKGEMYVDKMMAFKYDGFLSWQFNNVQKKGVKFLSIFLVNTIFNTGSRFSGNYPIM